MIRQRDVYGGSIRTPRDNAARDYAVLFGLNETIASKGEESLYLRRAESIRQQMGLTRAEVVSAMVENLGWTPERSEQMFFRTISELTHARRDYRGYMKRGDHENALRIARQKQLPQELEDVTLDNAARGGYMGKSRLTRLARTYSISEERVNAIVQRHNLDKYAALIR